MCESVRPVVGLAHLGDERSWSLERRVAAGFCRHDDALIFSTGGQRVAAAPPPPMASLYFSMFCCRMPPPPSRRRHQRTAVALIRVGPRHNERGPLCATYLVFCLYSYAFFGYRSAVPRACFHSCGNMGLWRWYCPAVWWQYRGEGNPRLGTASRFFSACHAVFVWFSGSTCNLY